MADFDDPSVAAFIQSFRDQLGDDDEWEAIARELGLPSPAADEGHSSRHDGGRGHAVGPGLGSPAALGGAAARFGQGRRHFVGRPPGHPRVTLPPARAGLRLITLRIDVDGVKPAVWRRLEVRSDVTMAEFHDIIQTAFEWGDTHLHRFFLGPKKDVWGGPFLASEWDVEEGEDLNNASGLESEVVLDQVLRATGDRVFYVYDFGDNWVHTAKVEKVVDASEGGSDAEPGDDVARATCIAGRRAGPLEDCGGPGQYTKLVRARAIGTLSPVEELEVPLGWDPARFSVDEVNDALDMAAMDPFEAVEQLVARSAVDPSSPLGMVMSRATPVASTLLTSMVLRARTARAEVTEAQRAAGLRSWVVMIGMVANQPMPLTPSGYLKPVIVGQISDALGIHVHTRSRREMDVEAVTALRESLKAMGYARHDRGELTLTKRGRAAADRIAQGDLNELWRDVAAVFVPEKGDDIERCARTLYGLFVAAGSERIAAYDAVADLIPELGWRIDGSSAPLRARIGPFVWPCSRLLDHVDASWWSTKGEFSATARALAFDAVFGVPDAAGHTPTAPSPSSPT